MKKATNFLKRITGEAVAINDPPQCVPEVPTIETVPPKLIQLIANAVRSAKLSNPHGKPSGSSHPVTVRGDVPSIAEMIRSGRR